MKQVNERRLQKYAIRSGRLLNFQMRVFLINFIRIEMSEHVSFFPYFLH